MRCHRSHVPLLQEPPDRRRRLVRKESRHYLGGPRETSEPQQRKFQGHIKTKTIIGAGRKDHPPSERRAKHSRPGGKREKVRALYLMAIAFISLSPQVTTAYYLIIIRFLHIFVHFYWVTLGDICPSASNYWFK